MPTLLLSVRTPLGSHSAVSGTNLPDVCEDLFCMLGFSPPVLGVEDSQRVLWCAVGHHERVKCDEWSAVSGGALQCTTEETIENCIAAIVVRRALPPQLGLDTQIHGLSALFPYVFLSAMRLRCTCCMLPHPLLSPMQLHPMHPSSSGWPKTQTP